MKEAGRKCREQLHQCQCLTSACVNLKPLIKYNREEMERLEEIPLITDDYYLATIPELHHANFMKDILDEAFDITRRFRAYDF